MPASEEACPVWEQGFTTCCPAVRLVEHIAASSLPNLRLNTWPQTIAWFQPKERRNVKVASETLRSCALHPIVNGCVGVGSWVGGVRRQAQGNASSATRVKRYRGSSNTLPHFPSIICGETPTLHLVNYQGVTMILLNVPIWCARGGW